MSWAVPNTCPCIAASTSRFVAPACNFSGASSAYSLKKYRCAGPGGGHGPPYPGRRKSVRPCRAPPRDAGASLLSTFSASCVVAAGRSYSTQCTQVPAGASGSSAISATVTVPGGAPLQPSGGDTSAPSHVYLLGMVAPSLKAGLESENAIPEHKSQTRGRELHPGLTGRDEVAVTLRPRPACILSRSTALQVETRCGDCQQTVRPS